MGRLLAMILLLAFLFHPARLAAQARQSAQDTAHRLTQMHEAARVKEAQELTAELLAGDPRRAAEVLGRVLGKRGLAARRGIIEEIERARLKEAVPTLMQLLDDPDDGFRFTCARALGFFKDESAVAPLERRLKIEPDARVRDRMRVSLAHLGRPYLHYYVAGLTDRDPGRRAGCMLWLGVIKDLRAVPHLLKLLASDNNEDVLSARDTLAAITGIFDPTLRSGGFKRSPRARSLGEFRQDCEAWLVLNKKDADRPIEPSPDAWQFTPEPFLPGLGVSFAMGPDEIRKVYEKAKLELVHHPVRRERENVVTLEMISAGQTLLPALNKRLSGRVTYVFENARLSEIRMILDNVDDPVAPLREPLRLANVTRNGGTGLDGAITILAGSGNVEMTEWRIFLTTPTLRLAMGSSD
jgi:hypothetical protein